MASVVSPPGRKARFAALLTVMAGSCAISACTETFGSSEQGAAYHRALAEVIFRQSQDQPDIEYSKQVDGLLVILDMSDSQVRVRHMMKGDTAASAMRILARQTLDPCQTNGTRASVAAYSPPRSVDLPISFERCSDMLGRVRAEAELGGDIVTIEATLKEQAVFDRNANSAIAKLLSSARDNARALQRASDDLTKIATAQQESWARAIAVLEELKTHR